MKTELNKPYTINPRQIIYKETKIRKNVFVLEELILKDDRTLSYSAMAKIKPTATWHLATGLTTNQGHCCDSHMEKGHIYICNALCKYLYQRNNEVPNARSGMPDLCWEGLRDQARP